MDYPFPYQYYDGVIVLYSLFHIPRDRHKELLLRVCDSIKPKGYLLITFGTKDTPYKEKESFCSAKMAWSFFDADTNIRMIVESGFTVLRTANEKDFGSAESHLWVIAHKN